MNDDTVYSNKNKTDIVDLGSDYSNKEVSPKQGLDGDKIDTSSSEISQQDLGDSYENNLIEEWKI